MGAYLYYDVKGIQSFIFKIPRLKFIVGGSALIDEFDKETVRSLGVADASLLFSGGGRGAFFCGTDHAAKELKEKIKKKAWEIGLDIQFGLSKDFSWAIEHADELYSFIPDMPDNGVPCPESGLYPVELKKFATDEESCHPVIKKRRYKSGEKVFRRFEDTLLKGVTLLGKSGDTLEFFHNVKSDEPKGKAGAAALGNRNRWAVICMDGNDIGKQFRTLLNSNLPPEKTQAGIQTMSRILAEITSEAAFQGVQRVVAEWAADEGKKAVIEDEKLILPIRPLLVGGDDIIVLCHCAFAATFVKEVMMVFEEQSLIHKDIWPATQNGLSISAGILYTSVTLPLHTAIPYAEALLENAKDLGREKVKVGKAPPACIDWEQITETVIDTPVAKRQRELIFFDEEISCRVKLTQRPYTVAEFTKVEQLAKDYGRGRNQKLPRTLRHQILPALRKGQAERLAFAARVKKNHPHLSDILNELDIKKRGWRMDAGKNEQSIGLVDALMLLEEDTRMEKETVK